MTTAIELMGLRKNIERNKGMIGMVSKMVESAQQNARYRAFWAAKREFQQKHNLSENAMEKIISDAGCTVPDAN